MTEPSIFDKLMIDLRSTCKYYTGYPKDLGPSRVVHFSSERALMQLLDQGHPVVVAFTIKGNYTKHLDKVLEEAAAEFHPNIKFMRVECPKYPGFCLAQQQRKREREIQMEKGRDMEKGAERKLFEYPFIEIYYSPHKAASQGKVGSPNITKYETKLLPFNYDVSAYGFREFFKRYKAQISSDQAQ
ncbi:hypothetical protein ACET3Z_005780 [Daucus carota]